MNASIAKIEVLITNPWVSDFVPLETWIELGPGPRELVAPMRARERDTGREIPLSEIPLRYRNNQLSRFLIEEGILEDPWAHLEYRQEGKSTSPTRISPDTGVTRRRMPALGGSIRCAVLPLEKLASLSCRCDYGTAIAIESASGKGVRGIEKVFRLFWQPTDRPEWYELPSNLRFASLWNRISARWPPARVLKLACDDLGVRLIFIDEHSGRRPSCWIREARFDFEPGKWSVRKIVNAVEYCDDQVLSGSSRALSTAEQDLLGQYFGL